MEKVRSTIRLEAGFHGGDVAGMTLKWASPKIA
jgi:hypothetical protein